MKKKYVVIILILFFIGVSSFVLYKFSDVELDDYEASKEIALLDTVAPIIELKGASVINLCPSGSYIEEGFIATDNIDGDITSNVLREDGRYRITYKVKDSSSNETSIVRKINYSDAEKPKIILNGKDETINYGSKYVENGFTATDNCDGNITEKVVVTNNVNTKKEGTYTVVYKVTDSNNNVFEAKRKVKVVKKSTGSKDELTKYLDSKKYKVSVGYMDLTTGYKYTYNAGKVYYGASLIKTVDALYIYNNTKVSNTDKELVKKAISVSDNASHLTLVKNIGKAKLRSYGLSLGAKYTLSGSDDYGSTVVGDQFVYMKELYKFITTNPKGDELKSFFVNTYCNGLIFDGLPTLLHKYGYYGSYYHDVGIVLDEHPFVIVVLSNGGYFNNKKVIQNISKEVYSYHLKRYE